MSEAYVGAAASDPAYTYFAGGICGGDGNATTVIISATDKYLVFLDMSNTSQGNYYYAGKIDGGVLTNIAGGTGFITLSGTTLTVNKVVNFFGGYMILKIK